MTSPTQKSRFSSLEQFEPRALLASDVAITSHDSPTALTRNELEPLAVDLLEVAPAPSDVDPSGTGPHAHPGPGNLDDMANLVAELPTDDAADSVADDPAATMPDPLADEINLDVLVEVAVDVNHDAVDAQLDEVTVVETVVETVDPFFDRFPLLAGDANRDGLFDSEDIVLTFQAGKYETGAQAVWAEGDFDSNGVFDSSDLIAAFQTGSYESRPNQEQLNEVHLGSTDQLPVDTISMTQEMGARKAGHSIRNADGGWTDEYTDFDGDGNRIGSTSETFGKDGMLRERKTTRTTADGGRSTTTETFDDKGKWTGTTIETYDKDGKLIGGTKTTPDGEGGTKQQQYDPESGEWKEVQDGVNAVQPQGGRKAGHRIGRADGGWTDEYTDLDKDGNRIGRSSETYDNNGMLRERTTTRNNADGGRTTTTQTYDDKGKWTGTTSATYDKNGKQTGGTKTAPEGKGGTTTQTYDPATGTWK